MERRAYLLGALAIASVATLGSCGRARFAMRSLFGDPPDAVQFSHREHLMRGSSCLNCHAALDQPKAARPGHDACGGSCHEVEATALCNKCHSDPERAQQTFAADRGLIFQHSAHRSATNNNCMRCHEAVAGATAKVEMPSMEACAEGCHQQDLRDLRCNRCHVDLARYPLQSIQSWAHTREFERRHGPAAKNDASTCTSCHEATFCSDCHADTTPIALDARRVEQTARGFIHPSPYEALHAIDAATRKDSCDTCHRPTFCTSCHAQRGVAGVEDNLRSLHPAGWLDPTATSFHGLEAKRSIASCAGCHDRGEQSVCVKCHQVGGTGGNPHPHKFLRRDIPEENRMCRTCHINGR